MSFRVKKPNSNQTHFLLSREVVHSRSKVLLGLQSSTRNEGHLTLKNGLIRIRFFWKNILNGHYLTSHYSHDRFPNLNSRMSVSTCIQLEICSIKAVVCPIGTVSDLNNLLCPIIFVRI